MNYKIFKTDLKPWLKKFFFEKFSYIVKAITGTVITITDGIRKKVNELKLSKESTQRTPTYKGMFRVPEALTQTKGGLTFTVNDDGSVTVTGTSTEVVSIDVYLAKPLTLNGTYTFSLKTVGTISAQEQQQWLLYTGANLNPVVRSNETSHVTRTLSNVTITHLRVYTTANRTLNCTIYPVLEESETPTGWDNLPTQYTPSPDYPQEVKTVKGYRNLFDKDNSTIFNTYIGQSTHKISTNTGGNGRVIVIPCKPNTKYYIKKFVGAKLLITGTSSIMPELGTEVDQYNLTNKSVFYTFTTNNSANYLVAQICDNNDINAGYTIQQILNNFQITEGDQELPYVSYGTNWIYTKVIGKNVFNKENTSWYRNNVDAFSNTANSSTTRIRTTSFSIAGGKTYTVSGIPSEISLIAIRTYDSEQSRSDTTASLSGNTFTLNNSTAYIYLLFGGTDFTNETNELMKNANIQIEEGSTATSYEQYKESIVPIPLNGNEICGIDNYKDELIVDKNGHCWFNKKIKKILLDGSENWSMLDSAIPFRLSITDILLPSSNNNVPSIFSNYYKSMAWNSLSGNYCLSLNSSEKKLRIRNNDITTLADFKTWLSTHNTDVYYALETPQLIDLNYTVDIHLFKGINNISNSDYMDMAIKYYSK